MNLTPAICCGHFRRSRCGCGRSRRASTNRKTTTPRFSSRSRFPVPRPSAPIGDEEVDLSLRPHGPVGAIEILSTRSFSQTESKNRSRAGGAVVMTKRNHELLCNVLTRAKQEPVAPAEPESGQDRAPVRRSHELLNDLTHCNMSAQKDRRLARRSQGAGHF